MTAARLARRAVAPALAAALLAAGAALLHTGAGLAEAVQVWRGFYTLAVASDSPALVGRLEGAGLGPVVAAVRARELVTTFRGYEAVTVADLGVRLDRLDPRYDPYLQAVGEWFAAGPGGREARIVYVASSLPPAAFGALTGRALAGGGVRWEIAGLPWRDLALALAWYVAAAAALAAPRGGAVPRRWRAAVGLPWLFLVAQGGLPAAFVAVPAHFAVLRLARWAAARGLPAPRRRYGAGGAAAGAPVMLRGGAAAAALVAAVVLAEAAPAGTPVAAMARYLAVGASWSAALAVCAVLAGALRRRTPPAPAGAAAPPFRDPLAVRLAGAAALAAVAAALVLPAGGGAHVPRPDPAAVRAPATLADLARFHPGDEPRLPVLADYVTHLAYQQTLAVGRPYRLPAPGERVTVDHYRRTPDGRVAVEQREVARFTEEWLAGALADAAPGSVAALLAAQGGLVAAGRAPPAPPAPRAHAPWAVVTLLLCGWIIGPAPAARGRSGDRAEPRRV